MKKATPLLDRILIRPDAPIDITEAGIIIPETAKRKQVKGTVYSVAEPTERYTPVAKEGDRVQYQENTGVEVILDDEVFIALRESEILCFLHDN